MLALSVVDLQLNPTSSSAVDATADACPETTTGAGLPRPSPPSLEVVLQNMSSGFLDRAGGPAPHLGHAAAEQDENVEHEQLRRAQFQMRYSRWQEEKS